MQYRFFTIPAIDAAESEEELNRFLRGRRVVTVDRRLIVEGGTAFWSVCVEYLDGTSASIKGARAPRVDYKEVLSPEDFAVFSRLRDKRKELANAEAMPVYAICTNRQLAEMAQRRVASVADVKKIEGLGDAKGGKYGPAFVEVIGAAANAAQGSEESDEAGGASD